LALKVVEGIKGHGHVEKVMVGRQGAAWTSGFD